MYRRPEEHPRISDSERALILRHAPARMKRQRRARPVSMLVRYRQTWGVVLAKAILDPYWFLVADWFALFLVSRGFQLEDTLVGFWVPFVCADMGISWAGDCPATSSIGAGAWSGAEDHLPDLRSPDAAPDTGGLHHAAVAADRGVRPGDPRLRGLRHDLSDTAVRPVRKRVRGHGERPGGHGDGLRDDCRDIHHRSGRRTSIPSRPS